MCKKALSVIFACLFMTSMARASSVDDAAPSWKRALIVAGPNKQWRMDDPDAQRYLAEIKEPQPIYLFFHGSDGVSSVSFLNFLTRYGYLVIAPDSMAWAPQVNQVQVKIPLRRYEIEYAFAAVRKAPWADGTHIIAQGQSEGSISLAGIKDLHFAAAVFGGFGCGYMQYSIDLPQDVPVLSIQDPVDPVFTSKNLFSVGTCASSLKGRPNSYVVEADKGGHGAAERPDAQPIILKFLKERGLLGEPLKFVPSQDARIRGLPKTCRDRTNDFLSGFKADGSTYNRHSTLMLAVANNGGCIFSTASGWKTLDEARNFASKNCDSAIAKTGKPYTACTTVAEDGELVPDGLDAVVAKLPKSLPPTDARP
jgi:hypothetical protein